MVGERGELSDVQRCNEWWCVLDSRWRRCHSVGAMVMGALCSRGAVRAPATSSGSLCLVAIPFDAEVERIAGLGLVRDDNLDVLGLLRLVEHSAQCVRHRRDRRQAFVGLGSGERQSLVYGHQRVARENRATCVERFFRQCRAVAQCLAADRARFVMAAA